MTQSSKSIIDQNSVSIMTIEELERRVGQWAASIEGTAQIKEAAESARIAAENVTSDAKIDVAQLRQAVTL